MSTDLTFGPLAELTLEKFDQLVALAARMPQEHLNAALPMPGSNSVVQLLVHSCGVVRRWTSTVNLGVPVFRDRDAEFEAVLSQEEVLALAAATRRAFVLDVAATDPAVPPVALPEGRAEGFLVSTGGVLAHVLEELSQHLGHAQITRDALAAGLGG